MRDLGINSYSIRNLFLLRGNPDRLACVYVEIGAIIDSVLDAAKKNNAIKVNEVFLEIGELTALNPDQLKFIFETITQGTAAQGAFFNISTIKPSIRCKKCSYKGDIESFEKQHTLNFDLYQKKDR